MMQIYEYYLKNKGENFAPRPMFILPLVLFHLYFI